MLVGGGAFARELLDWFGPALAEQGGGFAGYLDDGDGPMAIRGRDLAQLGRVADFTPAPDQRLVLAIGAPAGKLAAAQALRARGAVFASLVHPRAWVSASARIGQGVVVGPFADVSADALLADFVTLNAFSSAGHDVTVGEGSTLSGYVDLTGGVRVGRGCFFGSGARVLPGLEIGDGCSIGAGAVVVRSAPPGATLYAAPARRL